MGLGDATPEGAGVGAASGSLGPADAALGLVAVVDVSDALAVVPLGVATGIDVLNADEGDVLVLAVETALVTGEDSLHVEAGGRAVAGDLTDLSLEGGDLLAAGEVGLTNEGGALGAADGLGNDGGHYSRLCCGRIKKKNEEN